MLERITITLHRGRAANMLDELNAAGLVEMSDRYGASIVTETVVRDWAAEYDRRLDQESMAGVLKAIQGGFEPVPLSLRKRLAEKRGDFAMPRQRRSLLKRIFAPINKLVSYVRSDRGSA